MVIRLSTLFLKTCLLGKTEEFQPPSIEWMKNLVTTVAVVLNGKL
jgi:hypothetical protein